MHIVQIDFRVLFFFFFKILEFLKKIVLSEWDQMFWNNEHN